MADIKNPKVGQNVIQYLVSNTKLTNEQIKSIAVQGDMGGTSVIQGNGGTVVHRKNISLYPNVLKNKMPETIYGLGLKVQPYKFENTTSKEITQMFGKLHEWEYPKVISLALTGDMYFTMTYLPEYEVQSGFVPQCINWNGADIWNYTVDTPSTSMGIVVEQMDIEPDSRIDPDWLKHRTKKFLVSLDMEAGKGISITPTDPDFYPKRITVDCNIATQRGLLASPVPGDVSQYGYNYWLISGLFWGDCEHDHFQPSTANYYNYYNSIKSVECIIPRQVEVPVLDPETGQPTGETETITEDYNTGDVYMSLYDVTPCLSCETSGGIFQWKEEIRWKDASGQDAQGHGVNHYQTHLQIAPAYRTYLNVLTGRPSSGDYVLSSHNGDVSWEVNSGGGPGPTPSGGGMPWPNYANLDNNSGSQIMNYTRYQAGANGGWLRISYKGTMTDDCYYVKIGPDGNSDPTIGLWRVQTGCGYYGQIGNTWLLPVPPNNYIYVSFPSNVTTAWFDSSLSQDSPQPVPPAVHGYGDIINSNYTNANNLTEQAYGYYQECIGYSNYDDANEYAEYAETDAQSVEDYAADSEAKNAILTGYGITGYTTTVTNTRNKATLARGYATDARTYANSLPH